MPSTAAAHCTCFPDVDEVLREIRRVLRDRGHLTIAAFRRDDGTFARARADLRRRLYGIDSFTPTGLMQRLDAAGFSERPLPSRRRNLADHLRRDARRPLTVKRWTAPSRDGRGTSHAKGPPYFRPLPSRRVATPQPSPRPSGR